MEDAVQLLGGLGRGAQLANMDIKKAYRNVPVHPQDQHLLSMQWGSMLFVDTVLPFGLRSAPKIFNALADGVEWITRQQGVQYLMQYLDDFLVMGPPDGKECHEGVHTLLGVLEDLGLPIAEDKLEGPGTKLTFVGVEIDSEAMEIRLPQEKLSDPEPADGVGRSQILLQERVGVLGRYPGSCLLRGETGKDVYATPASSHSSERIFQIGSSLVARVFSTTECPLALPPPPTSQ